MIIRLLKKAFPLYWELLVLYILINVGIYNTRWMFVAFVINALTIIFRNSFKYAFPQLFFLLPFTMIYKVSPESSSFLAYALVLMSMVAVAKTINKASTTYSLLLIYAVFLFVGIEGNWLLAIKAISALICLVYFVKCVTATDLRDTVLSSVLGVLGASYMGLSKMTNPAITRFFTDFNSELINGEQIFRFSGLMPDPNYYSVSVIVAMFMLALLIRSKVFSKYIGGALMFALLWFGTLSYSRAYFLALFLLVLYLTYSYMGHSSYGFLAVIAVPVIFVGVWTYLTSTEYYSNAVARFEVDDVSSGRTTIWANYLKVILSDLKILLVGSGYNSKLVRGMGAHNTYIEALYHIGIIGLILLLSIFTAIFKSRGPIKGGWERFVLLFILCIMIGTLGFFKSNDLPFYLMMVWASMYYTPTALHNAYSPAKR